MKKIKKKINYKNTHMFMVYTHVQNNVQTVNDK